MGNIILPILAAVAGFTGTMVALNARTKQNPSQPGARRPWDEMVFRWNALVDLERWSAKRARLYRLGIDLLSEPDRLRDRHQDGDLYRYEVVQNIVKGGLRSGYLGEIERKDATKLKAMMPQMFKDPSEMIVVLEAGEKRAILWAAESAAIMRWARGIGEWLYLHPGENLPRPPKATDKTGKMYLDSFQRALAAVLEEIPAHPNYRRALLDFTQTN